MRHPDQIRKHVAFASITVALLLAAFIFYLSVPSNKPNPSVTSAKIAAEEIPAPQPEKIAGAANDPANTQAPWPEWGGALNSARLDGNGFFNRQRAKEFAASVEPEFKKYIVELNSRSLLPLVNADLADIFGPAIEAPQPELAHTVYVQFKQHLNDEQRANLKSLGVELLSYVSGYAWAARGTQAAFQSARQTGMVRGLAQINPHDKMHPALSLGKTPDYAKAADGRTRFSVLTYPGTAMGAIQDALNANPKLADAVISQQPVSVLGPRFEVIAAADLAREIAALKDAAFVGLVPPPAASRDANTDRISNIEDVRDNPPNLNGSGVKVAVREIGKPDLHADYADRLTYVDNDGSLSPTDVAHATAVVGQIASNGGVQPGAKGVAPAASVLVYSLNQGAFTTPDVVDAAARGARISNHSYGPSGVSTFGDYDPISADWDAAIRTQDLVGFFAGNQESGGLTKHIDFFVGAKNTICVTATTSNAHAGDDNPAASKSDGIASFVEFGPMNDGRVKPDLAALGSGVTLANGTGGSTTNTGTSFSTPVGTGVAALVFQHFNNLTGRYPSAALTKALLCNSATDLGNAGPDAMYGFGIINAEAAIKIVSLRTDPKVTPFLEDAVNNGLTKTFNVDVQNSTELRLTMCWMDVAGNPSAAKALVNDLNVELEAPDGAKFHPFSLNPADPLAAATASGPNTVDPIEQIVVANPASGLWTIRVTGASIPAGSQSYAICVNQVVVPPSLSAVITASPTSGTAPLSVMFTSELSTGNITKFRWEFGDGSVTEAPDIISIEHVYSTPGTYTATLTLNDSAIATQVIRVNKPVKEVAASKGRVKLSFRGSISSPDDSLQFMMFVPELIVPSKEARTSLLAYAGKPIVVRVGGTVDTTTPASKVAEVVLDTRGSGKSPVMTFKLNLPKGEMKVQLKKVALEEIFSAAGMTRDPASSGIRALPVEVETDVLIYRGVLSLDYRNKNGKSGSAKSSP